ncbi:MAG: hypothetical protein JXC32_21080 [Anaerolineae bacterium]|nr:hypothetical protein [Anaerolineae bacterium]
MSFETWGTWRRGDEPYGELTQTQEQVKGGQYAAKLVYQFPAVANDYVVFTQSRAVSGQPDTFSAWVYGDGSGQYLNLWIRDAQGEIWSVHLGTVGTAGWRQMVGRLAAGLPWPSGHIGGPDNGIVDYPVQFYALVLDRPAANPAQGTIYVDEIGASTQGSSALPTVGPTTVSTTASPTPSPTTAVASGDVGRIIFTVQSADGYYLYTTDPAWTQMLEIGRTDLAQSTCGSAASASTLDGRTFSLFVPTQCAITERTDACSSPDASYKLITSFQPDYTYSVLLQNVASATETFVYQGRLNDDLGIQWARTSQHVYFGIDTAIHVVGLGGDYLQVVSQFDPGAGTKPTFTPDGTAIFFMKPSGGLGNSDVFIVNVDGSGERNLTNAAATQKLCPRWRF